MTTSEVGSRTGGRSTAAPASHALMVVPTAVGSHHFADMDDREKSDQIIYNTSLQPLADLLDGVKRPGDYFSAGACETPMPSLKVKGAGIVSFPVPPAQARKLMTVAERAPYGRGDQTLVDENVRKVWQISPQKLSIGGKGWERSLQALTARIATDLGCSPGRVTAEFYKLLIYEKGGFFAAHRDTEKSPGMFGTLVFALPSAHEGGDLLVRHAGRETIIRLCNDAPGEIRYAAFYADCEHDVRPVTRGYRVCLVYNLVHTARSRAPVPPDHRPAVEATVKLLQPWAADDDGGEPRKLVYLLDHHYTQAALSFAVLKGADAARATVLKEAAARAGCALHLGILHIEESGWAEHTGYGEGYYSRRRRFDRDWGEDDSDDGDDSAFEVGEVCDGRYFIAQWRDAADQSVDFGEVPLDEDEVLPAAALDDAKPDEQHFSEATGNEGASFERTYLRAALVLWPVARFDEVCASAGLDATIARLGQLVTEAVGDEDAKARASRRIARERVLRFATLLPSEWPQWEKHGPRLDALLSHLAHFGDAGLIEELTAPVLAKHYAASRNPALLACARVLGPARGHVFFAALFDAVAAAHPGGCLDLWRGLATGALVGRRKQLEALLEVLVAAVPKARKPAGPQQVTRFGRTFAFPDADEEEVQDDVDELDADELDADELDADSGGSASARDPLTPETIATFLAAVEGALDDTACMSFLDAIAGNPAAFAPETLLLPYLVHIADDAAPAVPTQVAARLWEHCAAFYLRRSATPPPEPRDWAQPTRIPGSAGNPLLRQLEAFARDPHAREWRCPAATAQRALLHRAIEQAKLDMTHATERKGRPYTLVCAKTRATYERAVRRYQSDLADMRRLLALAAARTSSGAPTVKRLRTALSEE